MDKKAILKKSIQKIIPRAAALGGAAAGAIKKAIMPRVAAPVAPAPKKAMPPFQSPGTMKALPRAPKVMPKVPPGLQKRSPIAPGKEHNFGPLKQRLQDKINPKAKPRWMEEDYKPGSIKKGYTKYA